MNIHEKIDALIEDNDTHIGKLTEYLQIDRKQLYRWRRGEAEMGIYKLKKICEYYGVSADYILGLPRGMAWPRG